MLSRVSPGLVDIGTDDNVLSSHMTQFKWLFVHYLNHREIFVRKLAAKSLVSFSSRDCLMVTLDMIQNLLLQNLGVANLVHGCLLSLSYAIKLMKCELADEFTENQPKLIRNLDDISASIS